MTSPVAGVLRRPRLLLLVYLLTLGVVAILSAGLVWLVSNQVMEGAIEASVASDQSLLRAFIQASVTDADLTLAGSSPERAGALQTDLADLVQSGGILRVKLWAPDGTVVLSDVAGLRGQQFEVEDDLRDALTGIPRYDVSAGNAGEERAADKLPADTVVGEYLPVVRADGSIPAVFEVYRDAAPILARVDTSRRDLILLTLIAIAALAVLLRFIFLAASRRLDRQTRALVEATRRDGLTGMLNHGAIVDELSARLERARTEGAPLTIALIDVDNFRLLNENHGHPAGDIVLREIANLLRSELAGKAVVGRFGPDEFLAIAAPETSGDLVTAIERLRTRIGELSLRLGGRELLPASVSAAIASFPAHADATTELLSAATVALGEAKASGGDAVRIASRPEDERRVAEARNFDVLKGLVIAIDTKDRYTLRHSEDVARYATFLAERMGLPDDVRRTLRVAGLLHDVGKIGIPDWILRKPAALTPAEYDIVKQHVALGNLIVRDLPDLDAVRSGIRNHHERWDGSGYLDHLVGEQIPIVARILAVADAFSAMTSSRPYRKALSVRESLRRLEDSAGTQLDPALVGAFVAAIEAAPDAPQPGLLRPDRGVQSLLEGVA